MKTAIIEQEQLPVENFDNLGLQNSNDLFINIQMTGDDDDPPTDPPTDPPSEPGSVKPIPIKEDEGQGGNN